jgi:hypothetical protein
MEPEENSNREKDGRVQARDEREKKDGEKEGERKGAIWQSCTGSPVLSVCLGISDLHAIIFLSLCPCPIWAVLFRLSFFSCHVPAILCPALNVLS